MDKPTKPSWLVDADENDPLYAQVREMAWHVASGGRGGSIKSSEGLLFESTLHMVMIVMRWARDMMYVPDGKPQLHVLWMAYDDNSGLLYVAPQPAGEEPCSREERAYQYFKRVHDERERVKSLAKWDLRAEEARGELSKSARWVRQNPTNQGE